MKHAFVLSEVSVEISNEESYSVLDAAKELGHTKVKGRGLDATGRSQFLLVETTNNLTQIKVLEQVGLQDELGPWPVHIVKALPASTEGQDFQSKLMAFLMLEGKTLEEVNDLFTSTTPMPNAPDLKTKLVNAISSLVEKCQVAPAEIQSYRKLCMFSGVKPTPSREEYDACAEQTTHMLEEWQCSDTVKEQRVAEGLKGSAADIIRFLRVSNPNATAHDYFKALENAFGTTESAADFRTLY